jgi:hypothetical protein
MGGVRPDHGEGAAAVASCWEAVLTEIYLCNICLFLSEMLRRNGRGQTHPVQQLASELTIQALRLTRTTVLHVAPSSGHRQCTELPRDVWLPEPGYNMPDGL